MMHLYGMAKKTLHVVHALFFAKGKNLEKDAGEFG